MSQIEMKGICKSFTISERPEGKLGLLRGAFLRTKKHIKALDDICFSVEAGELVGYIGPNGAGKSTTIKIMSGILTPDSGHCTIMGRVPWRNRVAHVAGIGVVFGQRSQLWWDVPVHDSFELLKDIYRVPAKEFYRRLKELAEILDIGCLLKTPVRQLSLGQRMRCEIIAALLHSPRLLFLDEPTIGLDAVSKLALRDFLKNENRQHGLTMLLTTHDMDDIETMCERVLVIGKGKLLFDGKLKTLKETYAPLRRIVASLTKAAAEQAIPGAEKVLVEGLCWTIYFNPARVAAHTMIERLTQKLPLTDIAIQEEEIDQIIATMYRAMQI